MRAAIPAAAIPETAVVLAGARVFDPCEQQRLAASAITQLSAHDLGDTDAVLRAVDALRPKITGLYLHIDLDVLDEAVARVNIYGAPGGISGDTLVALVEALLRHAPVRALTLSAYDPAMDVNEQVPPIALRILDAVARHFKS